MTGDVPKEMVGEYSCRRERVQASSALDVVSASDEIEHLKVR